jgi:hypothetical protein
MGGRKSYPASSVIGTGAAASRAKRKIKESIKSKSSEKIVTTTIDAFVKSDKLVKDFSKIFDTFNFIKDNAEKPPLSKTERKKLAADFWTAKKKEKQIDVPQEIDRIFVDTLTNVVRRGEKK